MPKFSLLFPFVSLCCCCCCCCLCVFFLFHSILLLHAFSRVTWLAYNSQFFSSFNEISGRSRSQMEAKSQYLIILCCEFTWISIWQSVENIFASETVFRRFSIVFDVISVLTRFQLIKSCRLLSEQLWFIFSLFFGFFVFCVIEFLNNWIFSVACSDSENEQRDEYLKVLKYYRYARRWWQSFVVFEFIIHSRRREY